MDSKLLTNTTTILSSNIKQQNFTDPQNILTMITNLSFTIDSQFHQQNFTLDEFVDSSDPFAGVFGNIALNWAMLGLYLLGFASCGALGFIAWFEVTGEAGPNRTLINRLSSYNLIIVSSTYLVAASL